MKRSPALLLAALLAMVAVPLASARAQGFAPVPGGPSMPLPLVLKKGGWARYLANSSEGPAQFVIRVGAPARHKGQKANWIDVETEVPLVGRVAIQLLVVGDTFEPANIMLAQLKLPGEKPQLADEEPDKAPPAPKPKLIGKTKQTVAGRTISIAEYALEAGVVAGWSRDVPGVGLTHVRGPEPVLLVAFGTGGDPWQEAAKTASWPEKSLVQP